LVVVAVRIEWRLLFVRKRHEKEAGNESNPMIGSRVQQTCKV
jgi:hypothetical protein